MFHVLLTFPKIFSVKVFFYLQVVDSVALKWQQTDKYTAIGLEGTTILAVQPFIRRYGWTLCFEDILFLFLSGN